MGHYPFTLFNGVTVLVLALVILIAWQRFRGAFDVNWPLAGYAAIVGYTIGFKGGLNPYGVAAAVICGLAIRLGFHPRHVRWAETAALAYVAWRSRRIAADVVNLQQPRSP